MHSIEDAIWCYGSPLRDLLIKSLQEKNLTNYDQNYQQMYQLLINKNHFVGVGRKMEKFKSFLLLLAVDGHVDILGKLANFTCKIPNRSLMEEINGYFDRKKQEISLQLKLIESMISNKQYHYINMVLLMKRKYLENKLNQLDQKRIEKKNYKNRIRKLKQSKRYKYMEKKNLPLSNMEIISIKRSNRNLFRLWP